MSTYITRVRLRDLLGGTYESREVWDFLDRSPSKEELEEFESYLVDWLGALNYYIDTAKWRKAQAYAKERAERRAERAKLPPIDPSEAVKELPRGLQVLAFDTDNLTTGFPYPPVLAKFHIPPEDWDYFLETIFTPLHNTEPNTLAKNIEAILDNVAEQDIALFRPKGLIMRMDMPGEQKFGLDFMDLYHSWVPMCHRGHESNYHRDQTSKRRSRAYKRGHVDNLSGANTSIAYHKGFRNLEKTEIMKNTELGAIRFNFHASTHHLCRIRREMYEGTRIVLDVLTVLDDPETAYRRGWTNWIKQCEEAKETKPRDEGKPRPSFSDYEAVKEYYEPFPQRPISERVFRWPPSKQLYYDRWRGNGLRYYKCGIWTPYEDSMDKRMKSHWHPRCVVPADEIAVMVMKKNGPRDQCFKKHKHMVAGKIKGKTGPVYPGRRPRRRRRPGHHWYNDTQRMLSEESFAGLLIYLKKERQKTRTYYRAHPPNARDWLKNDPCELQYH
jgi:hypothetical protein